MLRNKTALKIISLFTAILLWIYVMGAVDPETRTMIRDIPVTFTNTEVLAENGLAVVQEEEIFVNATVEGRRSDVNDAKKTGLAAVIDVSQCSRGKNTGKITVNMPEGVSLEALSMNTATFKVETFVSQEKPVEMGFSDVISGTDKMVWILQMEPETITVSGAKSSVEKITALTGIVSANKAEEQESRWVKVPVIPVDKKGEEVPGVTVGAGKVKVEIQIFSIKSVDLAIVAENAEADLEPAELDAAKKIQLIGPADTMEALESVTGTVDLTGITGTASAEISLELPENVFLLDEESTPIAKVTMKAAE